MIYLSDLFMEGIYNLDYKLKHDWLKTDNNPVHIELKKKLSIQDKFEIGLSKKLESFSKAVNSLQNVNDVKQRIIKVLLSSITLSKTKFLNDIYQMINNCFIKDPNIFDKESFSDFWDFDYNKNDSKKEIRVKFIIKDNNNSKNGEITLTIDKTSNYFSYDQLVIIFDFFKFIKENLNKQNYTIFSIGLTDEIYKMFKSLVDYYTDEYN